MPEKSASVGVAGREAASRELVELQPQFERMNRVLHMNITESPEFITLQAEVPGFEPGELAINLEPHRLTILGKKSPKKRKNAKASTRQCSCEVLRVFDLSVEVDAAKTTATLKAGVLEVHMPKVRSAQAARLEVKGE
jgi:HSP20 family protein